MNGIVKIILALILVSVLLLAGCSSGGGNLRVGTKAPDFKLSDLDSKFVTLSGLRGKAVVINFWATWCVPCRLEMPHLQAFYDEWSGKGGVLLAINLGEDAATVKEFMRSYRYTLPVLLDSEQDVAGKYNVEFIPTTFFIDKDGIIQNKIVGAFKDKDAIEKYLPKIMP